MNLAMTMRRGRWVVVLILLFLSTFVLIYLLLQRETRSSGQLIRARFGATAYVLSDGKVLMLGGTEVINTTDFVSDLIQKWRLFLEPGLHTRFADPYQLVDVTDAEEFDPATNTWTLTGKSLVCRRSIDFGQDKIMIVGQSYTIFIYDVKNSSSLRTFHLPPIYSEYFSRVLLSKLNSRKVLFIMHPQDTDRGMWSVEYDLDSNKFDSKTYQNLEFSSREIFPLRDGGVMSIGGVVKDNRVLEDFEIYDHSTHIWKHIGESANYKPGIRVNLINGSVLMIYSTGDCKLLDPQSGNCTVLARMIGDPKNLSFLSNGSSFAFLLKDNRVLYIGQSCQIYDPVTNRWSLTNALPHFRLGFTASLLNNGKVLVAGGMIGYETVRNCELYDPATGTWTEL